MVLTVADNLMVPGATMHDISAEGIVVGTPDQLQWGAGHFEDGCGITDSSPDPRARSLKSVWQHDCPTGMQPIDNFLLYVLDKKLRTPTSLTKIPSHPLKTE